jgi:hypothetical protein
MFKGSPFANSLYPETGHPVLRRCTDRRIGSPPGGCRLLRRSSIYPADGAHKANRFEHAVQLFAYKVGNRNARRHKDPIPRLSVKGRHRNPDPLLSGVDVNVNLPAGIDDLHHRAFKRLRHAFRLDGRGLIAPGCFRSRRLFSSADRAPETTGDSQHQQRQDIPWKAIKSFFHMPPPYNREGIRLFLWRISKRIMVRSVALQKALSPKTA